MCAKKNTADKLLDELPAQEKASARRVRQLEKQLADAERRLHELRVSKFRLPTGKPKRRKASGTFLRLIIPDTHGCMIDPDACKALLADLDDLQPAEVVLLGDHMDCGGHLDEKRTPGYVKQHDYSVAEDEDAANQFLDEVQKRCGAVPYHYLEGNHEWRMERSIVARKNMNAKDARRRLEREGPQAVLHLEKRGIPYYRRGEKHMGLNTHGVIKLGKCLFTHGLRAPKHAAAAYADRFGTNVVYGHTHRAQTTVIRNVEHGEFGAWCPGCMCELQPVWRDTDPTDWSHGYAWQIVEKSGEFLYLHVPIIDGKSYLRLLAAKLGA